MKGVAILVLIAVLLGIAYGLLWQYVHDGWPWEPQYVRVQ